MREDKNIPFKNYIILAICLLLSIVVIIYFYMWYSEFKTNKVNTPVLDQYFSVINYNELDNYLVENKNVILYVSSLSDAETRLFEKKFKKVLNDYTLNDVILYLNLTDLKKNNSLYKNIVSKYELLNLPCFVIFEDNKVIDSFSIKDNNFDLDLLISYLRIEGVIND